MGIILKKKKKKKKKKSFFILRHTIVAGYYGFTLNVDVSVCVSVRYMPAIRLSVRVSFPIFTNLPNALTLWRSRLGLLMDKVRQILTESSARDMSVFSFPDINLSKYQWICTKLGMCIDILEI